MGENYLYHYTSIDALEKILSSRKIRFSSLDSVDDLEEVDSKDIKRFGKLFFVSCWTDEEEESIPMWKMYSDHMEGVRIKLGKYPFKQFTSYIGKDQDKKKIETFINVHERESKNLSYINPVGCPSLVEVEYTDDENLIYPHIKKVEIKLPETKEEEIASGVKSASPDKILVSCRYETDCFGRYKRKCWSFQKEWRYILFLSPYTYEEFANCKGPSDIPKYMSRIENSEYLPNEKEVFLELKDNFESEIEILLGPCMPNNMANEIYDMAKEYGIEEEKIKKSKIKIRKNQEYKDPRKYPCGEEMITFLRKNPDVRQEICEKMQNIN